MPNLLTLKTPFVLPLCLYFAVTTYVFLLDILGVFLKIADFGSKDIYNTAVISFGWEYI